MPSNASPTPALSELNNRLYHRSRSAGPWTALLKKELQQISILVIALFSLAVMWCLLFPTISYLSNWNLHSRDSATWPPILLPIFYALGAGPLLVGQEKESKTLLWLSSLPIARHQIVLTKLIAAIVGFIVVCLIGITASHLIDRSRLPEMLQFHNSRNELWLPELIPAGFLFLIIGITTAWISKSPWYAIGYQIALGIIGVPIVYSALLNAYPPSPVGPTPHLLVPALSIIAVLLFVLGYKKIGESFRSGDSTPTLFSIPIQIVSEVLERAEQSNPSRLTRAVRSLDTSLVWQAFKQNSMAQVFFNAGILLGLLYIYIANTKYGRPFAAIPVFNFHDYWFFLIVTSFLICCLGVVTFGSDTIKRRVHFLSDRGVAPGLVWWTRLFPAVAAIAIVATFLSITVSLSLLYTVPAEILNITGIKHKHLSPPYPTGQSYYIIGFVVTTWLYLLGFSQWFTQASKSIVVAFCIAPIICITALIYALFVLLAITPNYYWLLPTLVIPYIATRTMTRAWMDGNYSKSTILKHLAFLSIAFIPPLYPLLHTYLFYPDAPQAIVSQLRNNSETDYWTPEPGTESQIADKSSKELLNKQLADAFARLREKGNATSNGVDAIRDNFQSRYAFLKANQLNKTDDNLPQQEYQETLELLFLLAKLDRYFPTLKNQEIADRMEKLLVEELSNDSIRSLIEPTLYNEWVVWLKEQDFRNFMRRRAILNDFESMHNTGEIPGILSPIIESTNYGALTGHIVLDRQSNIAVGALLAYLDSGEYRQGQAYENYSRIWQIPTTNIDLLTSPLVNKKKYSPGLLWHGEWERTAQGLQLK